MKKIILLIFAMYCANILFAQNIPNPSFENWTFKNSKYYDPDGWNTFNPTTSQANVITCIRGSNNPPPNTGIAYLMLTSKSTLGNVNPGLATTGILDYDFGVISSGYPFTARPSKLTGKWQYMGYNGDNGVVAVVLTKQNANGGKDTIASCYHFLKGMEMSWAEFSLDLVYQSNDNPDSCLIMLSSSNGSPKVGSYLYVDALSFMGASSVNEMSNFESHSVYPNPAKDMLNIECSLKQKTLVQVEVMDIQGKQIKVQDFAMNKGENQVSIDLSDVQKGIYFVRMTSDCESLSQKLLVE